MNTNTPAYRKGRREAQAWLKVRHLGRPRPVSPYNGAELSVEWQAGFEAAIAARRIGK